MGGKGFCEDLDEWKMSYPLIQAVHSSGAINTFLMDILRSCCDRQKSNTELKKYILEQGSVQEGLRKTKSLLHRMHAQLLRFLMKMENKTGGLENWGLRLLIMKLDIDRGQKAGGEGSNKTSTWKRNQQRAWANVRPNKRPINHVHLLDSAMVSNAKHQ